MSKLKIEYMNIDKLIPYINNPRLNDGAVDKVASSIKNFGFKNPIIIDKDNEIIAGHTRLKAARKLGLEEIPVIKADDLTEQQIKAFRIADNKTGELAEWDFELLENELEELKLEDFDLELTGFDFDELDELFQDGEYIETEEDDFEIEEPENPISKRGDVWLLGRHRLMCGDSASIDDVGELVNGKKADLVYTDPPYGVNYQSNMSKRFDVLKNDDEFLDFIPCLLEYSKQNIHWYIWTSHNVYPTWREMFNDYYKHTIIWYKGGGGMGDLEGNYASDYEMALFCHFGRKELNGKRSGAVWEIQKDNNNSYVHPTQKPIALAAKALKHSSNPNEIVLDLFGGSGSTLIACEQLNRICYMMELDEKYVDVIVNRYISFKESDDDVFLIRDGEKYHYTEVSKDAD